MQMVDQITSRRGRFKEIDSSLARKELLTSCNSTNGPL